MILSFDTFTYDIYVYKSALVLQAEPQFIKTLSTTIHYEADFRRTRPY